MFRVRIFAAVMLIFGFTAGFFASSDYITRDPRFEGFSSSPVFTYFSRQYRLGLDLQGGTHLVYRADFSPDYGGSRGEAMAALRDVIERRVNLFGVTEPVVQTEKAGSEDRLIVELAGITDIREAIRLIGETPFLEFREVRPEEEQKSISEEQKLGKNLGTDPFTKPTGLDGKYLSRASLEFDQQTNVPIVGLQFTDEGAKLFEEITGRNIGKPLAIYLDGSPIEVPTVREKISGGRAQISGQFTPQDAKTLVGRLNAGALPVPITLVSQQSVEASLGRESLAKSFNAAIWGFLAVMFFMVFWYRLPGAIAIVALFIYTAMVLSIFKLIPVTLTAAGIAGFILSVGMAVDANILIFERFKEELRRGRALEEALRFGFERAWTSIRDSNVSSLITSAILFWLGTSVVKGFALTLGIGVLISMFSAITVSRTFFRSILTKRLDSVRFLLLSGFNR